MDIDTFDCGACVPECPYKAVFPEEEVPAAYTAKGSEITNQAGLTRHYENTNHHKEQIVLETTRVLAPGEVLDLKESIKANYAFYA